MDKVGSDSSGDSIPEVVRRSYDWETTSPSIAIIETIADMQDADPFSLFRDEETTLHDYVDPEALDSLVADQRRGLANLTVGIDDYTVRINGSELTVVHSV